MEANLISIILGFIEGFGLIISPCILPILPVFLAASLTGSKKRPLGIIVGFTLFFAVFVFFSRQLVHYSGVDLNTVRNLGYVILLFLGVIMMSNYLSEKFGHITQSVTRAGSAFVSVNHPQAGFFNGFFFGSVLALIWTPCAGPILAAIIVQTVVQKATWVSFFTLIAFALGATLPMFIISLYGKKIMNTFGFLKSHAARLRQCLGAVIIVSVVYMAYFAETVTSTTVTPTGVKTSTALMGGLWHPYPAPSIEGIETWINSKPLQLNELKGKVVLIDFWTYSCINCLRTLPYIKDWYQRYHDKGLVIIGVHTPEFDFEKKADNVSAAVKRYGILYPVALDNQFLTWTQFSNHYWPAHYLIDKQGKVVYTHFGEGDYDITENNIRFLLGINELAELKASKNDSNVYSQTPETYLGYDRADVNLSPSVIKDKTAQYYFSDSLPANAWSLDGMWQVNPDNIMAMKANAALKIQFNARHVFLVMGNNSAKPIRVNVLLNGQPLNGNQGKDVKESSVLVDKYSLYDVVSQKQFASGTLEIIVTEPGVTIYTLTFGN